MANNTPNADYERQRIIVSKLYQAAALIHDLGYKEFHIERYNTV